MIVSVDSAWGGNDTRHDISSWGGRVPPEPYSYAVLLLSLVDDPDTNRPVWIVEFDGVLAGRFESKEEVAAYLRRLGHRIDPDDAWPRRRLL